ncbi:MAG: hypothetical protein ACETVM_04535 [Candidatus Bathyarchaeia archaeon]
MGVKTIPDRSNLGYDVPRKLRYSIANRGMQYPTRNNSAIKTETILEISV